MSATKEKRVSELDRYGRAKETYLRTVAVPAGETPYARATAALYHTLEGWRVSLLDGLPTKGFPEAAEALCALIEGMPQ